MTYLFRKDGDVFIADALDALKNKFEEYGTKNIEVSIDGINFISEIFEVNIQSQYISEIKEEYGEIEIHLFNNFKLFGTEDSYIIIKVNNQ